MKTKKEEKELINKDYGKDFHNHLLEQYKLYVESADKISSRRDSANHFYLTLNSALFAISGYLSFLNKNPLIFILIPLAGIIISFYWMKTIKSYRNLNSGKFKIIHKLEDYLPASIFKYEWQILERGKTKIYLPLTVVEKGIPNVFIAMYILIIILMFA